MLDTLKEACERQLMGRYLRFLSLFYAYGAYAHLATIFGLGKMPIFQAPLPWKMADVSYAVIDAFVAVWLFRRSPAGVVLFLFAALSQLVIYLIFPHLFIFTATEQRAADLLVFFHVATVGLFVFLFLTKR